MKSLGMADKEDGGKRAVAIRKVSPTQANNPQESVLIPRTFAGGETFQNPFSNDSVSRNPVRIPVVLYGGAFDPPTLAHEAAVRALSRMAEKVVIVPSGPRDDKSYKVCEKSRLRVLRIFAERFA